MINDFERRSQEFRRLNERGDGGYEVDEAFRIDGH